MTKSDERLISTKQIIDYFQVTKKHFYNFDSFLINKDETRHSIIVFRLNK